MKKISLLNVAKKAQIALAVMAVCGLSFVGMDKAYAETVEDLRSDLNNEIAARIGADAAQDKVIAQVNKNLVDSVNTINGNIVTIVGDLNNTDVALNAKIGELTEDGSYVKVDNNVAQNLSALDEQVKANTDAIGTYDPNTTNYVISTNESIKSNLSSIDKTLGDFSKLGDDDYSITTLQGEDLTGDTLNVTDALITIDDKVGDLNKENKFIVEDEDGNLVEIGSYHNIDGKTSLAENMENLDAVIGTTNDGAYINSKDSVGQNLNALDNQVLANKNAIDRLDNKVNKVGAGAAALAALHPLDFDPDDKLTFAAGFGNYQGENSAAIGAFYRPDEKVMFSVAGSMGNGENMVNAGISFALDRTAKHSTSKAVMAKKLADQEEKLAAQDAKIARLEAMVAQLAAKK